MKRSAKISSSKVTNYCYGIFVVELQGSVPLRVWDRLGFTAQEDTVPIRAKVCIGLKLNYTFYPSQPINIHVFKNSNDFPYYSNVGIKLKRSFVYLCFGTSNIASALFSSTNCPFLITAILSHTCRMIGRSLLLSKYVNLGFCYRSFNLFKLCA